MHQHPKVPSKLNSTAAVLGTYWRKLQNILLSLNRFYLLKAKKLFLV